MSISPATKRGNFSRRKFLTSASALGATPLLLHTNAATAEPPPETTKLRLIGGPITCLAPYYVAEELLLAEGFTDVHYVNYPTETELWPPDDVLAGAVDITFSFIPTDIQRIDTGAPLVVLAGSHIGCVELVAAKHIKSTRDLKGKAVGIDTDTQVFISMFVAYVGLDPHRDINWVNVPYRDHVRMLSEGKIDAFMSGPPLSLELRRKDIGHVLVDITKDKPWSNYFCCLIATTRNFVAKYPVATRRALRAIIKGADVCATEPKRVAKLMAGRGLASYDDTLQVLRDIPYGRWREFDTEDSLRFFALRMRDVGAIKSTPQRIIADGTDLRFFNELKRELKT